jgi:Trypsin-co-occurring domain 1
MGQERLVVADGVEFFVEVAEGEGPRPIDDRDGALSFRGVRETVTAIGTELTQAWETVKPDEARVEFALKLTAKSGKLTGLLVEGGGEASLTVALTWKSGPAAAAG